MLLRLRPNLPEGRRIKTAVKRPFFNLKTQEQGVIQRAQAAKKAAIYTGMNPFASAQTEWFISSVAKHLRA